MPKRPGGELASRPLHFIWICDCSGSMQSDGKIQSLNNAIREAIPHMQRAADENNSETLVNYIKWASTAVLKAASSPASQSSMASGAGGNVPLPAPPPAVPAAPGDVW